MHHLSTGEFLPNFSSDLACYSTTTLCNFPRSFHWYHWASMHNSRIYLRSRYDSQLDQDLYDLLHFKTKNHLRRFRSWLYDLFLDELPDHVMNLSARVCSFLEVRYAKRRRSKHNYSKACGLHDAFSIVFNHDLQLQHSFLLVDFLYLHFPLNSYRASNYRIFKELLLQAVSRCWCIWHCCNFLIL